MSDYPAALTQVNHVEPVLRRIRAVLGTETVVDTTHATYVWEWPFYPQYYIPWRDVRPGVSFAAMLLHRSQRAAFRPEGVPRGRPAIPLRTRGRSSVL